MRPDLAIDILKHSLASGALVMTPLLLAGMVVGTLVAAIQAATQVNEPTLTFVPKALAIGLIGAFALPWGIDRLVGILQTVLHLIPTIGAGL